MSDRELFRMNEHGDVWSEPDLFEQGGENVTTSKAGEMLAATAEDRAEPAVGAALRRAYERDVAGPVDVIGPLRPADQYLARCACGWQRQTFSLELARRLGRAHRTEHP